MALCDDELTEICQKYIFDARGVDWDKIFRPPTVLLLQSHHIDILLSSEYSTDRISTFRYIDDMTPEQIDKGIADTCLDVRFAAYNHNCCTEAQKVKYILMWGDDDIM